MNKQESWDRYFLEIANTVSGRSTCLARKVGAVITKENRIMATGYNGVFSGLPHCTELGFCHFKDKPLNCLESQYPSRAVHAELNAIAQCAKYGIATDKATMYVTHEPCLNCLKAIIASGINRIIYEEPLAEVKDNDRNEFLLALRIEYIHLIPLVLER